MGKFEDLTGLRFGRLVVIGEGERTKQNRLRWNCKCDCGNVKPIIPYYLKNGNTKSCGCLQKEVASKILTTHGLRNIPEYEIWASMIQRCTNKQNKQYANYGGRGITVCERWKNDFQSFYDDMGPRPSPNHSVERMDNNLGYAPDNCKWATIKEQSINKRARSGSKSGVRGVIWYKPSNKWYAYFTIDKKYTYLGSFDDIEDAIKCRKEAEIKYWNKKPS